MVWYYTCIDHNLEIRNTAQKFILFTSWDLDNESLARKHLPLFACCSSGLPFLGAKWIQAALLPFDASLSNLFAKDASICMLNSMHILFSTTAWQIDRSHFLFGQCLTMFDKRGCFEKHVSLHTASSIIPHPLGSVWPWYQDSSLASDSLLS